MRYKGSIKRRLVLIIMSVTLLTGLIGYGSFVYWYMNNQYDKALKLANTVSLVLAQDFAKLVLLNEVSAAADISSSLKSFSNLESMVLYTLDSKAILQYSKNNKSFKADTLPQIKDSSVNKDILKLYLDAKYQGTHLGYVQLKFKIDTITELLKRNFFGLLIIIVSIFFLSSLLAIYFAKKFTHPILNLVKFLEKVKHTDSLSKRSITNEQNEYGKLYNEVNKMLERIEASHKVLKLAAVAFETQNGITITDKDEKILQVNKAFTDITGYEADEVIGRTPRVLQSGYHGKEFYDEMKRCLREDNIWVGEVINRHKNGSSLNEHLTIHTVLDDNNGEVLYYVASFLDITLQKKTEAQLEEKEIQLLQKSKMAAMGEMIENIAHQWRQPLSIISTISSGILLKKDLDLPIDKKEEMEDLHKIGDTVQYLSNTIDDFRSFFKENKLNKVFNLKDCYLRAFKLVESKFTTLNIKVIENLDDVEIATIENELIQVILNILNNAKDILQEKNEKDKRFIFISLHKKEDEAILSIKDNGGGIPKEIINSIFEAYFTTKEKDGTGIGLNMSKEMVEVHMKGSLLVENETFTYENCDYTGANFIIKLPLKK